MFDIRSSSYFLSCSFFVGALSSVSQNVFAHENAVAVQGQDANLIVPQGDDLDALFAGEDAEAVKDMMSQMREALEKVKTESSAKNAVSGQSSSAEPGKNEVKNKVSESGSIKGISNTLWSSVVKLIRNNSKVFFTVIAILASAVGSRIWNEIKKRAEENRIKERWEKLMKDGVLFDVNMDKLKELIPCDLVKNINTKVLERTRKIQVFKGEDGGVSCHAFDHSENTLGEFSLHKDSRDLTDGALKLVEYLEKCRDNSKEKKEKEKKLLERWNELAKCTEIFDVDKDELKKLIPEYLVRNIEEVVLKGTRKIKLFIDENKGVSCYAFDCSEKILGQFCLASNAEDYFNDRAVKFLNYLERCKESSSEIHRRWSSLCSAYCGTHLLFNVDKNELMKLISNDLVEDINGKLPEGTIGIRVFQDKRGGVYCHAFDHSKKTVGEFSLHKDSREFTDGAVKLVEYLEKCRDNSVEVDIWGYFREYFPYFDKPNRPYYCVPVDFCELSKYIKKEGQKILEKNKKKS